ncbi:hypothetical protein BDZ94DRAFT_1220142 [Collybia nuda]|uniref:Zn(2)-C6 fungal-type domain-containing protein n=1 Tax=Collybia nuda TaxID=64659 RepID=A0A9P5Y6I9_9AGAR|nr:hypothetical protein BDZ94DRAFT_1220142 [Collybia nuda]
MSTFTYPDQQPQASSSSSSAGPSTGPPNNGISTANNIHPGPSNGSSVPSNNANANAATNISSSNSGGGGANGNGVGGGEDGKKKKPAKRRKVNHACLYCRRSHMTCDEGRPCQRCIKREIGHLCHDERRPKVTDKQPANAVGGMDMPRNFAPVPVYQPPPPPQPSAWPLSVPQSQFLYQPETLGNEFSVLTDFLETLDDGSYFSPPPQNAALMSPPAYPASMNGVGLAGGGMGGVGVGVGVGGMGVGVNGMNGHRMMGQDQDQQQQQQQQQQHGGGGGGGQGQHPLHPQHAPHSYAESLAHAMDLPQPTLQPSSSQSQSQSQSLPQNQNQTQNQTQGQTQDTRPPIPLPPFASATKTEQFLLTAADQESGSRNERLNRVIRSKYEAGLLKPYNYVKGYARLSRWMDRNVSQESKQQILQPLSVLRPKFRAVAQSLRDLDLVFIEEAFERLLLDYDRVFSAMGVPACLWRRTGEIYKGNREFTELVGVDGYMMRDGRLCIYELMAEESAVNYWEKYGHVAFDSSQKAVLTSCVLRYKPHLHGDSATSTRGASVAPGVLTNSNSHTNSSGPGSVNEEGFINCCFSFTIRRDKWGIPTMIVGNFIRC